MTTHTQLYADDLMVKHQDGSTFCVADFPEDAEQVVQCVNACEGINPDAMPDLLTCCKRALETYAKIPSELQNQLIRAIAKAKSDL
jgi:hypothetical protein